MLSKEEFVKILGDMQKSAEFRDDLAAISRKYWCGDFWDYPHEEDICCKLLNHIFGLESDKYGTDIDYFVSELNYGKDWKPGMVTEADGTDVDFSTAEKLYDYLLAEYKKKNK